jgi:hypothetical protein
MIKVRILDRCEFCDGEVSMREVRCLTAIELVVAGLLDLLIWPVMAGDLTIGVLLLAAVFGAIRLRDSRN